jgi:hypothetical protein
MDARPKTRQVDRERKTPSTQVPRGAKQIVIPMTQQQYDDIWHDADRVRSFIEQCARSAPELFPAGFDQGYCLHGFGRESLKLSGLKLRKIVLANGASYWLRPSFIFSYMIGTADELAYPLLLAAHGVPFWLLTLGFGHNDMFWYRLIERLGRNSLVGTTVHDPAQLPSHLAADEHHADWAGQKGYVATTVGEGCILGVALTASADDAHLEEAYGVFAAEARDVEPEYAPETVNTDGWASTRNAFQTLFPLITVVLCFLHGFLKIRDRCRKARELHRRVWDVYRAATAEEFRRLMNEFSAVVCNANLDHLGARDADEAVEQDGVLRGGLFPSGMPSHEQRGGSSHEPAVPTDVCKPGPARPSRLVRVTVTGLGLAVELSPLRPSEQPTPHPRQSRPSTQRQTLS